MEKCYFPAFLILIRPPYLCDWLQAMWIGYEIYGLITWYVSCCLNDYAITWSVICCAKCQFPPFLPFSSITMPRSWEILLSWKTPENSTFLLFRAIYGHQNDHTVSLHIVDQNRLIRNPKIDSLKSICNMLRVTWYALFGRHNPIHKYI